MATMTTAEYLAYECRRAPAQHYSQSDEELSSEAELQAQICDECARRGWQVFRSRMDKATRSTKGTPDLIIQCDKGRTLYVECKAGSGKLSQAQLGVMVWADKLGHTVHVARSLTQFLGVVEAMKSQVEH